MSKDVTNKSVFDELIKTLDIPESAYEKAERRYEDLGKWFCRPEAKCYQYSPHIYSQGSFRLGTVVRPLNDTDEYDLDIGCRLRIGITKSTHTQKQLKDLVGSDMEEYRRARNFANEMEEKHRCWRLQYEDELSFHMDTVPSIPEEAQQTRILTEGMIKAGSAADLAENVTSHAGAITDNRHQNYNVISTDWRISNSEGYALWFESRIKLAMSLMEKRAIQARATRIDDLPARKWQSPLQKAIQILKRHRDVMFAEDPEGKPISIIITTLAAEAYQGEQDVVSALERILTDMGKYVRSENPQVPNPVNPLEDFADKWNNPKYAHLNLRGKFSWWHSQAVEDFDIINRSRDVTFLTEQLQFKYASVVNQDIIRASLGFESINEITSPKRHSIVSTPAKPWLNDAQ